jgi:hypothetical protein
MSEKLLAVIVTLGTAFTYFVGWTYLYFYYEFFGIDIFEIGPSVQYTLVYAFPALRNLIYPSGELYKFLPTVVVFALVIFAIRRRFQRRKTKLVWTAATVFAILLTMEGYYSAKQLAWKKAAEKWMALSDPAYVELVSAAGSASPVNVPSPTVGSASPNVPSPTKNGYSKKFEDFNKDLSLMYLLSTPQFHYLFTRELCKVELCTGFLFRVSVANVRVLMILHRPEEQKK